MPSTSLVGTCDKMCPSSEAQFRIKNNLVHSLECSEEAGGKAKPCKEMMIKKFARSAAGCDLLVAEQLRPAPVLCQTVDYLLQLFCKLMNDKLEVVYNFVVDRLRAVRQDMVVQRLDASNSVRLIEKMLPFYVETEYLGKTTKNNFYEWKLHSSHMEDCFSIWSSCIANNVEYSQETLFLYFFHNPNISEKNNLLSLFAPQNRQIVLQLHNAFACSNFVKFFRIVSSLPSSTMKQSLVTFVYQMRLDSFRIISIAYKARGAHISLSVIKKWLLFDTLDNASLILAQYFTLEEANIVINSFNCPQKSFPSVDMLLHKFDNLL